jgi:hypothetical protein
MFGQVTTETFELRLLDIIVDIHPTGDHFDCWKSGQAHGLFDLGFE